MEIFIAWCPSGATQRPFVGLFVFDDAGLDWNRILAHIKDRAGGQIRNSVHAICVGASDFMLFWYCPPETPQRPKPLWRAYKVADVAPAYFLHNLIEHIASQSVEENAALWFPAEGKENHRIAEIEMKGG